MLANSVIAAKKSFNYELIDSSASYDRRESVLLWKSPKGFEQIVVSDESAQNFLPDGCDDWNDMNVLMKQVR